MIRWTFMLGALMLTGAAHLGAQDTRLTDRLSAEAAGRVQQFVDSAEARELPTEPLVDVALEGAAKEATDERILLAVERLFEALVAVRATLGAGASASELTIGAYALRQGMSQEGLRRLRESRPTGDMTVPLGVALDLVGRGVIPDSATEVVARLTRLGDDQVIRRLVREVDRSLANGLTPEEAWRSARLHVAP